MLLYKNTYKKRLPNSNGCGHRRNKKYKTNRSKFYHFTKKAIDLVNEWLLHATNEHLKRSLN